MSEKQKKKKKKERKQERKKERKKNNCQNGNKDILINIYLICKWIKYSNQKT